MSETMTGYGFVRTGAPVPPVRAADCGYNAMRASAGPVSEDKGFGTAYRNGLSLRLSEAEKESEGYRSR